MDLIDLDKYNVEFQQQDDNHYDDIIQYLLSIINDRSIPENQKQHVRKQFDEVMKMIQVTKKPPVIILSKK